MPPIEKTNPLTTRSQSGFGAMLVQDLMLCALLHKVRSCLSACLLHVLVGHMIAEEALTQAIRPVSENEGRGVILLLSTTAEYYC